MSTTFHGSVSDRPWLHASCSALLALGALLSPADANATYGFDPGFNPNYTIDAFASAEGGDAFRRSDAIVRLPDGDVVLAGTMRFSNDPLAPGYANVGLVRYDRDGARQTWPGASGPYFWFANQYVVYPNIANGGSGDARIVEVNDFAYVDGKFYVLVTRTWEAEPFDYDTRIIVFNGDGSFRESVSALSTEAEEIGVALDVRETGDANEPIAITVLAWRDFAYAALTKFNETSAGLLARDVGFNGGNVLQVTLPTCSAGPICYMLPVAIVRPDRLFGLDNEPIYVAGSVFRGAADVDFIALKFNASGALDTSFGSGGRRIVTFDRPGSDLADAARDMRISTDAGPFGTVDSLWISGSVSQSCKTGIGVVKLDGDGLDAAGFGINGRAVYGGSTETGTQCEQESAHDAVAMVGQGNEIAVAGTVNVIDQGGTTRYDAALLRIDAQSGAQRSLDGLPLIQDGIRVGDSFPSGIVDVGLGRYVMSGNGSWPGVYSSLVLAARLWPADRVFANGFDSEVGLEQGVAE